MVVVIILYIYLIAIHAIISPTKGGFMCGIVGYVGGKNAQDFLISGLKRLEYRGYDSAGIETLDEK